jgi:hypothetical protein
MVAWMYVFAMFQSARVSDPTYVRSYQLKRAK